MIVPSSQALLISAPDKKQLFLFDPKTACVLHTYSSDSALAPTCAYYPLGQQFIFPHLSNTYINIWDADAQQAKKYSIGEGDRITSMAMTQGEILYMGSAQGYLYVYELPSGILIRKVQVHSQSSEVRRVLVLQQQGYVMTCTRREVKLWQLGELLVQQQKPVAERTVHSVADILGVEIVRGILCVVTETKVDFYYANNLSLFSINRDLPELSHLTCCCASEGSLLVGDMHGRVKEIPIDAHERELRFEERKGRVQVDCRKGVVMEVRDPVSALAYVDSLGYVVVGNVKGEVKIYQGKNLKNSVQLFKQSTVSLISVIERPNKQQKIPQSLKIKSFHKQQKTKTDQPIHFDNGDIPAMSPHNEIPPQVYLQRMLAALNDPHEQLQAEIEGIRKQNQQLLEANLHYCSFLEHENNNSSNGIAYR